MKVEINIRKRKLTRWALTVAAVFVFSVGALFSLGLSDFSVSAQRSKTPRPKATPAKRSKALPTPAATPLKFPHTKHSNDCASCHKVPTANWKTVRTTDPFPDVTDYPKHESCLVCHREQFFKGDKPAICTICHTNPSPDDSTRHPFANPRELFDASPKGKSAVSAFQISFPHDKHIDIVSENRGEDFVKGTMFVKVRAKRAAGSESCNVCHKTYLPQGDSNDEYLTPPPAKLGDAFWLKKGTFKTSPIGHTTCFTCHSEDTGILPAPTDCATCHKTALPDIATDFDLKVASPMNIADKIALVAWRKRDSSATFRHEFSSHTDVDCTTCHTVGSMITTEPLSKKVKITSCDGCHITATLDDGGVLNYEIDERKKNAKFECVKCHIAFGSSAIPETHLRAVGGK